MNIALSAIVLLVLVSPGITYRRYRQLTVKRRPPTSLPFAEEIASSVISSVIIHAICVFATSIARHILTCIPYVQYSTVICLLAGNFGKDGEKLDGSRIAVVDYMPWILAYFFLTHVIAILCAYVVKTLSGIKLLQFIFHPDLKAANVQRFEEWSEVLADAEYDWIIVTTVIEIGKEGAFIYAGVLDEVAFDESGGIETLRLTDAHRKEFNAGKDELTDGFEGFYRIRGDYFILQHEELKTLNILYMDDGEDDSSEVDDETIFDADFASQ